MYFFVDWAWVLFCARLFLLLTFGLSRTKEMIGNNLVSLREDAACILHEANGCYQGWNSKNFPWIMFFTIESLAQSGISEVWELVRCSPPHRFLKFNVDGVARGRSDLAGVGGNLHNDAGQKLLSFSKSVGVKRLKWSWVVGYARSFEDYASSFRSPLKWVNWLHRCNSQGFI